MRTSASSGPGLGSGASVWRNSLGLLQIIDFMGVKYVVIAPFTLLCEETKDRN